MVRKHGREVKQLHRCMVTSVEEGAVPQNGQKLSALISTLSTLEKDRVFLDDTSSVSKFTDCTSTHHQTKVINFLPNLFGNNLVQESMFMAFDVITATVIIQVDFPENEVFLI